MMMPIRARPFPLGEAATQWGNLLAAVWERVADMSAYQVWVAVY